MINEENKFNIKLTYLKKLPESNLGKLKFIIIGNSRWFALKKYILLQTRDLIIRLIRIELRENRRLDSTEKKHKPNKINQQSRIQ